LRAQGLKVKYVRNITDIDDKIIKRALENQESVQTLTERFIDAMHEDEAALNVLRPDEEPRATDYIDAIQSMVKT
jgi:cysteinyl-tRNA synthetase